MKTITYDARGRLNYNPFFHPNMGKTWTESDMEYLCKYYEIDDMKTLSLALGRTANSLVTKKLKLEQQGKYEYYKNLNKHW